MKKLLTIEQGQIGFFYRSKIDVRCPKTRSDIQRFYLLLLPDKAAKGRLLVVGKKRLPQIIKGKSKSTEREWSLVSAVAKPERLGDLLRPEKYRTDTKGERTVGEAIPAGEGRYAIFIKEDDDSSMLVYELKSPKIPGHAQKELGILQEARFIISVRNPEVKAQGFPDEKPDYPKKLKQKFAKRRWLSVDNAKLLDYENVQCLLIGARKKVDQGKSLLKGKSGILKALHLNPHKWPTESLNSGAFIPPRLQSKVQDIGSTRSRGSRKGGKKARHTDSAAGVTRALKGISFPKDRPALVRHARKNNPPEEVVSLIKELPKQKFNSMADVTSALGKVRPGY